MRNIERFLDSTALRSVSLGMTGSIAAILLLCALPGALAQESPTAPPSPTAPASPSPTSPAPSPTATASPSPASPALSPTRDVRISFVPPPIEGTISLGVYDKTGKLVRVLHRESDTDDFTIGHDALITEWDGKNDAGEDLPVGKYNARGYMVGALKIEGVDYFFNDWVVDENSPHLTRIENLALNESALQLEVQLASGEKAKVSYDILNDKIAQSDNAPIVESARGKDGSHWTIVNSEIQQLSPTSEILRRLAYQPGDPQPKAIAASDHEDKIFVLEENQNVQRVRGLTLLEKKIDAEKQQSISDWKVDFEKAIVAHKDFGLENGAPVAVGGTPGADKIVLRLRSNPLKRDQAGKVEVAVGFDQDGSFLKTNDGLPLRTISDTPNLVRALVSSHDDKTIDVFQDDRSVVEQFRISNADQMMAFDCGDFDLK